MDKDILKRKLHLQKVRNCLANLKGATIYTPDKENMAYYRNTYYTESAQKEYHRGMKMKALAGGCCYDLESKENGR